MALDRKAKDSRKYLRTKYSKQTERIVKLYALKQKMSWKSEEIGRFLDINKGTVAATLANLTRGTYTPFVYVDKYGVEGTCRF